MSKRIFVLLFIAGLGLLLSGCAMNAEDAGYYYKDMEENEYSENDTTPEEPAPVTEDPEINGGDVVLESSIPALEDRKIIYTANMVMEDPEPSEVYEDIVAVLDEHTAYVESANIVADRYTVKIRVLSSNFADFVEAIKTEGELVSYNKSSEDVTNTYSTFEARKAALETRHTRLLELLADAVDLDTILALEEERFKIETELNQVGQSLANYDSLVDFSTVNLTIRKTEVRELVLPRAVAPSVNVEEIGKDYVALKIFNVDDKNAVTVQVDLLLNGEFVKQYEEDVYADSYTILKVDDLKSNKEYTFKITSIAADHQLSNMVTRRVETESTYFNNVGDTFTSSIDVLITILEYLSYTLIALLPYIAIGIGLFFPLRKLYRKKRAKRLALANQFNDNVVFTKPE